MTVKELKDELNRFGDRLDDKEVVIREFGTNNKLPLEMLASISLTENAFELITKEVLKK